MNTTQLFKGISLVTIGAISYGMLGTFVRFAYDAGYTTPEVTVAQFGLGALAMWLLTLFSERSSKKAVAKASKKDSIQLISIGTSVGFTTLFFYLAVKYLTVSIAVVLLMQVTWMSVVLESLLKKNRPPLQKILAVILVLIGTVLTTNVIGSELHLDLKGVVFGLLSAVSFTISMYTSNVMANHLSPSRKGSLMLTGGFLAAFIYTLLTMGDGFNFEILTGWGIVLALFGTVIPLLSFNAGFPHTGLALGSIITALEIPVSAIMAYYLLGEQFVGIQIAGTVLILFAVVILNTTFKKKQS